jgi:iron complex outermembrane receptor protein
LALFVLLCAGTTANAEESGAESNKPTAKPEGVEEVLITAERRTESAQVVPISIAVLAGSELKENIQSTTDIGNYVANVQTDQFMHMTNARYGIRGVSQSNFDPIYNTPIMIYLDDVILGNGVSQVVPLYDEERIEILRGPQGTLFGRNSTGGAFQYISRNPTDQFETNLEYRVGNYNERYLSGAVSGPISDSIRGRLAFLDETRDGDVKNKTTKEDLNQLDHWGLRGTLDIDLGEKTKVTLRSQYFNGNDTTAAAFQSFASVKPIAGSDTFFVTVNDALGFQVNPCTKATGFDCMTTPLPTEETMRHSVSSIKIEHDFGFATLTNIGAWVDVKSFNSFANNQSQADFAFESEHYTDKQWSDEIRLTSQGDSPFQWITGALWLNDETKDDVQVGLTGYYTDWENYNPNLPVPPDFLGLAGQTFDGVTITPDTFYGNGFTRPKDKVIETSAIYLHTTYAWTDRLTTTQAFRITRENTSMHLTQSQPAIFLSSAPGTTAEGIDFIRAVKSHGFLHTAAPIPLKRHDEQSEPTWRFAADYQLTDTAMVYSSVTKGFQGLAYQPSVYSAATQPIVADPETLIDYEIGEKSELYDHRLQLNAALYYYNYDNYQTNQLICQGNLALGCVQILSNLPKSRMYGGELEANIRPTEAMRIHLGLGYTHSEILKVDTTGGIDPVADALAKRLEGNELPFAQKLSHNGLIQYDFFVPYGTVTPEVSWSYTGGYYPVKENGDQQQASWRDELGKYWIFNARVGFQPSDAKYSIALWVKNIDDNVQVIVQDERPDGAGIGSDIALTNEHRTYGATFTLNLSAL